MIIICKKIPKNTQGHYNGQGVFVIDGGGVDDSLTLNKRYEVIASERGEDLGNGMAPVIKSFMIRDDNGLVKSYSSILFKVVPYKKPKRRKRKKRAKKRKKGRRRKHKI